MKIVTDVWQPRLDWAIKAAGHELVGVKEDMPDADVYLVKNYRNIGLIEKMKPGTKILVFQQTNPYPMYERKWELEQVAKQTGATVAFYSMAQGMAWDFKGDAAIIPPTLDFENLPDWQPGGTDVISAVSNLGGMSWAGGLNYISTVMPKGSKIIGSGNEMVGKLEDGFVGALPHDEVLKTIASCRLYFNSSLHAPLPYSYLEALAIGAPTISVRSSFAEEIRARCDNDHFVSAVIHDLLRAVTDSTRPDFHSDFIELGIGTKMKTAVRQHYSNEQFVERFNKTVNSL